MSSKNRYFDTVHATTDNYYQNIHAKQKYGGQNSCHSNYHGRVKRNIPSQELLPTEYKEERHSDYPLCIHPLYHN